MSRVEYEEEWRKILKKKKFPKLIREAVLRIDKEDVDIYSYVDKFIDYGYGEGDYPVLDIGKPWNINRVEKMLEAHERIVSEHGIIDNSVKTIKELKADKSSYKKDAEIMFNWAVSFFEKNYSKYNISGKNTNNLRPMEAIDALYESLSNEWVNKDQFKCWVVSCQPEFGLTTSVYSGNIKNLFEDYAKEFKRLYPSVRDNYFRMINKGLYENSKINTNNL